MLLLLVCTRHVQADTWTCHSGGIPSECSNSADAAQNSCLLRLYACGEYEQVIQQINFNDKGLNKTEHFYMGVSYFGLLNITRANTLRCTYIKAAKSHLEEFMDAVRTVCKDPEDPKTCTRNPVSFGGDSDVDRIYQAMKIQKLLAKETGCVESPHTRSSILRFALSYANNAFRGAAHGIASGGTAVENAIREGFDAVKQATNVFVTTASTLETRYSNYSALVQSTEKNHNDLAKNLSTKLVNPEDGSKVVSFKQEVGDPLATITINSKALEGFLKSLKGDLETHGVEPVKTSEKELDSYFKANARHYNDIRDERIKGVKGYLVESAKYYNIVETDSTELKAALAGADGEGKDGAGTDPAGIRDAFARYLVFKVSKEGTPCTPFNKNAWHCK